MEKTILDKTMLTGKDEFKINYCSLACCTFIQQALLISIETRDGLMTDKGYILTDVYNSSINEFPADGISLIPLTDINNGVNMLLNPRTITSVKEVDVYYARGFEDSEGKFFVCFNRDIHPIVNIYKK